MEKPYSSGMFGVVSKGPSGNRYRAEVRKEDLTLDNIRAFFSHVALRVMENEERGPELTESCIRERGTRLDWLGQEVPWDVFLTRASIALGIISAAKESTYYTKCLALEKLFEIAKMERKKRQKEMFRCVQEEELTPGNVQAVLRDAAQKFLGDENLSARISPVNCTLVRKGVGGRVEFCGRKMELKDFICSCAIKLHFAKDKTDATKCYDKVLEELFKIANIARPRSAMARFLAG